MAPGLSTRSLRAPVGHVQTEVATSEFGSFVQISSTRTPGLTESLDSVVMNSVMGGRAVGLGEFCFR